MNFACYAFRHNQAGYLPAHSTGLVKIEPISGSTEFPPNIADYWNLGGRRQSGYQIVPGGGNRG